MTDNNVHAYFVANKKGPGEMQDINALNAHIHSQIHQQKYIPVIFNHASNPELILANFRNSLTFANIMKILKKDMVGICTSSYIHEKYLIVRLTFPSKKIIPYLLQNCGLSLTQTNKRVIEMSLIVDKPPQRPFCKLISIMSDDKVTVNADAPVSDKSTIVHEAEKIKNDKPVPPHDDQARLEDKFSKLQTVWNMLKDGTLDPSSKKSLEQIINKITGNDSKLYDQLQQSLENLKEKEKQCDEQKRMLEEAEKYKQMVGRCKKQLMQAARNTGQKEIRSYSKNNDDNLSLEMVSFVVASCLSSHGKDCEHELSYGTNIHPSGTKRSRVDFEEQSGLPKETSNVPFSNRLQF